MLCGTCTGDRYAPLAGLDLAAHGAPLVPSFEPDDAALLFTDREALGAEGTLKDGNSPYRSDANSAA